MENDHFERQIKAKLDCWEVDPPADMWNRIQKELPTANTPSKQAIIYRYAFWGAAAAMLAGIILWVTKPSEVLIPESTKTFTQNSPTHVLPYSTTSKEQTTNFSPHTAIAEIQTPKRRDRQTPSSSTSKTVSSASISPNQGEFYSASFDNKETVPASSTRSISRSQIGNNRAHVNTYSSNYFINENDLGDSYYEYEEIPLYRKRSSGEYSIGIMAVNPVTKNSTTTNRHSALTKSIPFTASFLSANNPNKEDLEWSHNVPLTFGITVEKRISQSIGIETGITYSFLKSTYKNTNRSRYGNQELHYIGIPVTGIYRFARWNNFSFYSAIGGKVDFNIAGNRTDRVNANYEGFRFQGDIEANTTKSIRDSKAQFSLTCKIGAAYAFVDYLEMYAEPGLAYFFNNGNSEIQNMWKDKPLNFALQVGLRTNF